MYKLLNEKQNMISRLKDLGFKNYEIANEIGISESAVSYELKRISDLIDIEKNASTDPDHIFHLGLSIRTFKTLYNAKLTSIKSVIDYYNNDKLKNVIGLGDKSIKEILQKLVEFTGNDKYTGVDLEKYETNILYKYKLREGMTLIYFAINNKINKSESYYGIYEIVPGIDEPEIYRNISSTMTLDKSKVIELVEHATLPKSKRGK